MSQEKRGKGEDKMPESPNLLAEESKRPPRPSWSHTIMSQNARSRALLRPRTNSRTRLPGGHWVQQWQLQTQDFGGYTTAAQEQVRGLKRRDKPLITPRRTSSPSRRHRFVKSVKMQVDQPPRTGGGGCDPALHFYRYAAHLRRTGDRLFNN